MASGDRFYLLELKHRPALYGDLGSLLKIEGLVLGGEGAQGVFLLPGVTWKDPGYNVLTEEEWVDFLRRTDSPEVLVMPAKAFHRKVRYEISGLVQQKVWHADGLKCMYCGGMMGKVQLTIDHFIPLEMGGVNDTSNYLTACRRCNKDKGAQDPKTFCGDRLVPGAHPDRGYEYLVEYLAERTIG